MNLISSVGGARRSESMFAMLDGRSTVYSASIMAVETAARCGDVRVTVISTSLTGVGRD